MARSPLRTLARPEAERGRHGSARPDVLLAAAVALLACGPVQPPESGGASASARGTGPCITDEPRLIHYARWLATDSDPRLDRLRRRFRIEVVEASEVEQVSDPTVCQQAGSEYRAALDLRDPPVAVAVIRVGDRYIVTSRVDGSTSREFASAVVLDESLRVMSTFRDPRARCRASLDQ